MVIGLTGMVLVEVSFLSKDETSCGPAVGSEALRTTVHRFSSKAYKDLRNSGMKYIRFTSSTLICLIYYYYFLITVT